MNFTIKFEVKKKDPNIYLGDCMVNTIVPCVSNLLRQEKYLFFIPRVLLLDRRNNVLDEFQKKKENKVLVLNELFFLNVKTVFF